MILRRFGRLIVSATLALLTVFAAAPPAHASQWWSLEMRSDPATGRAVAYGDITFWADKFTFRKVEYLYDECDFNGDGDGIEAVLEIRFYSAGGVIRTNIYDTNGCGTAGAYSEDKVVTKDYRVAGIRYQLFQRRVSDGVHLGPVQWSQCMDNPHISGTGC